MVGCKRQALIINYSYCCGCYNSIGDLKTDMGKLHSPHKASQKIHDKSRCDGGNC